MKSRFAIVILFLNILTLIGCSSKKTADDAPSSTDTATAVSGVSGDSIIVLPADDALPFIDLSKRYPLKKINLNEVADIKYVPLETTDKSLIDFPIHLSVGNGKILMGGIKTQEILVFNDDGTYFTKISRQGGGPHEYGHIMNTCVDFANELVYVWDVNFPPKIKVYDYDGYMQRELKVSPDLPAPSSLYTFDNNRLIAYFDSCLKNNFTANIGSYQYWLIDAHTGEASPIDIEIPDAVSNKIVKHSGERAIASSIPILPMLKNNNQVVISDYTHPIVYLQQGSQLKPLIRKSENSRSETHETMSVVRGITDRYILFYVVNKAIDKNKGEVYIEDSANILYDRQTKDVYEVEFINPDTGKPVSFTWDGDFPHNTVVEEYHALVLDSYKKKGYLSGKLKEIAEQLDSESNPVLAIINFE